MSKYILPNFTAFKPQLINYSIKEVEKSYLYNGNYNDKRSKEKFQKTLVKINNKESLNQRDLKVLSYNLVPLEKLNKFDVFYKAFVTKINKFRNKAYFIRPFLSYIYNSKNYKHKQSIFNILKILTKIDLKYREKYNRVLSIIKDSNSLNDLIKKIETIFSNVKDKKKIEVVCNSLFIKSTDEFYNNCIINFIYNNYLNEDLWNFHRSKINTLGLPLKKQLFKKILIQYKNNYDIKTYPERWFKLIGKELGDPYDSVNQRWRDLEEEKEIFRRWNVSENMNEFFDRIVGGDKRRKIFWRKYVENIYRIEYFEEASQALVMEFRKHLFVEFAKSGNAMYYYDKNIMNINEIRSNLSDIMMSSNRKIGYLKQKDLAINKLNHAGSWEYKFEYEIQSLGYTKSRWT